MSAKSEARVRVGIVKADEDRRCFLLDVIKGTPGLIPGAACSNGQEAFRSFAASPPDICLVGLFLPDMPGTDFVSRAKEIFPSMACILLVPDRPLPACQGFEVLEAGARGYLSSPCSAGDLAEAIWSIRAGKAVLSPPLATLVAGYFEARGRAISKLTHRERQILRSFASGVSHQETAQTLGITPATVQRHVHNFLPKLNAHCTAEGLSSYLNPALPREV